MRPGNFRIIVKADGKEVADLHPQFKDTQVVNLFFLTWAGGISITSTLLSNGRYRTRVTFGKHPISMQGADNVVLFDGYSDGRTE